jgi:ankyrin repeat protein
VREGRYEDVAKTIDTNFNDDQDVASVHYQEPVTGFSALHIAVSQRNHALVKLLLANNIDVMLQDARGQTGMHIACIMGDIESYKALATHNYQNKNCVDFNKKTPLDYARETKEGKMIMEYEKKLTVTLYSKNKGGTAGNRLTPEDFEFVMPLGKGAFGEVILV